MKFKNSFETPIIASLLAVISGSIDAYTYIEHGGVFAGLQTGNIILLSINLGRLNFYPVFRLCFAIALFIFGIIVVKFIQRHFPDEKYRKKLIIQYEVVLLLITGITAHWVPNLITIGLLDMSAAAHLQEFKLLRGKAFNPLMMTGNLSKVSNTLYLTILDHDSAAKQLFLDTCIVILSFIGGAITMSLMTRLADQFSILLTLIPLFLILIIVKIYDHKSLPEKD